MSAIAEDRPVTPPDRARYGVDWSVKVLRGGPSTERYVLYGLSRPEMQAFLDGRGAADGLALLDEVTGRLGAPFRIMVGAAGDRTKVYGDLPGDDPAMVCVDLWPGRPHAVRYYRRLPPERLDEALALSHPRLRPELSWLAAQPAFAGESLFHIALQRHGPEGPYTGVDLGFAADWEVFARQDDALYQRALTRDMLARHGLSEHLGAVEDTLFQRPVGFVNYVGFRLLPDGEFAVNIYAVMPPVQPVDGALCAVDAHGQGFRARPLCVHFRLAEREDIVFRLRRAAGQRAYAQLGPWSLDYRMGQGERPEAELLEAGQAAGTAAVAHGSPEEPLAVLDYLRATPGITQVALVPDPTDTRQQEGLD